jgi:PAS domain S-box-containing protein
MGHNPTEDIPPNGTAEPEAGDAAESATPDIRQQEQVRVRLLIAIPVMIVLLLTVMGGILYQLTDHMFQSVPVIRTRGSEDYFGRYSLVWIGLMAAFDIVGALVGYYLARSITAPIHSIIRITEKVAAGDFSDKAPATRRDEVGVLGYTFNNMIESLNRFFTSRNRYILESFTGGLITTDLHGTVTAINSAAEDMLGVEPGSALGQPLETAFHEPGHGQFLALVNEILWRPERPVTRKVSVERTGGQPVTVSVKSSVMRDRAGRIFGLIINLRDLSELNKFYEQMGRTDRLATMGTFASGLAHEVRNPLGAIKVTAQLLGEDLAGDPRKHEFTQLIVREANRLEQLVREVQQLSQAETPLSMTDVQGVVRDALTLARNHAKAPAPDAVCVEEKYGDLPEARISADRVRQALLNILVNAFQAVPPGGTVRVITRTDPSDPPAVVIAVENTGPPVPADQIEHLFEPFYTTKEEGSGLGLSIASQIVSAHGGDIGVKNTADGVAVTVRLPLNAAPDAANLAR